MAFRADESIINGYKRAKNYLIFREMDDDKKEESEAKLLEIIKEYGPVIDCYPSWHPLVTNHDDHHPVRSPSEECGYKGLDHTVHFLNAFITCPYNNGQQIIDCVNNLPKNPIANIEAERLDVQLYSSNATPILVYCDWANLVNHSDVIPASIAVPLMLQKEIPCSEWSQYGESWETMRSYFLGEPHGSRSSLFLDQETALTMKKIWELLIHTNMFGPVR